MRSLIFFLITASIALGFASPAGAQTTRPSTEPAKDYSHSSIVTRMMAFDKKHDGKLTRDEITDARLIRLFDEADVNKTGEVTPEELIALAAKRDAETPANSRRGGRGGFDGGPDGPGGGPGMPPTPGQIMPPMLQDMLKLTDEQKSQVAELQKETTARLAKILTPEQLKQLQATPGPRGGTTPSDGGR